MPLNKIESLIRLCLLVVVALSCSRLTSIAGGPEREARGLINSSQEDLAAVRKMDSDLNSKMTRIPSLYLSKNTNEINSLLDDSNKLVEHEVELLKRAAEKLDKASQLKVGDKMKEYLALKKGAAQKRIEGYTEAGKMFKVLRDSVNGNNAAKRKAQAASQELNSQVRKTFEEAGELEHKAAELARQNPGLVDKET